MTVYIYTLYVTVNLVISLPKIPYMHRIYIWFRPTREMLVLGSSKHTIVSLLCHYSIHLQSSPSLIHDNHENAYNSWRFSPSTILYSSPSPFTYNPHQVQFYNPHQVGIELRKTRPQTPLPSLINEESYTAIT